MPVKDLREQVSEADFQSNVIEVARLRKWRYVHFRPGRTHGGKWATQMSGDAGWPDLVLARRGRLVFIELKTEKGKLSTEQAIWLGVLEQTGAEVYVFRPSDWDELVRVLT